MPEVLLIDARLIWVSILSILLIIGFILIGCVNCKVIKENRELTEENINLRNENEILKEKVKKFNREKFELPKNSKEKVDNKNGRK